MSSTHKEFDKSKDPVATESTSDLADEILPGFIQKTIKFARYLPSGALEVKDFTRGI